MTATRRDFLQSMLAGGAFVLGAPLLGPVRAFANDPKVAPWRASLWLTIDPQGTVTIVAHRSEMGTGIRTCLPAVLADELEADLERVEIEQALGDARYGSQNTDGSCSIVNFMQTMREVGATARHMLEQAAANVWKVPRAECKAENHRVHHAETKRSLSFGKLAAYASQLEPPAKDAVKLKPRSEWRYMGKGFASYDAPAIARGQATFGADVRLTGMKFVTVARAPVYGAPLEGHDATAALQVPGVEQVVVIPGFKPPHLFQALGGVAVVATSTWAAIQGRRKLTLNWGDSPHAAYDSDAFREELLESVRKPGKVLREAGDVDGALASAAKTVRAEYTTPLLAHAPMEPPVAVAHVTASGCEAWAPTQNPQAAQDTLAAALGLPKEQVKVHVTLLGGGFGRKSKPDYVAEAAIVSKEIGAPVQVVWTREDDLRHDFYHAPAAMRFEGGLDEQGQLACWAQRSAFSPIASTFSPGATEPAPFELMLGATDVPYAAPNLKVENCPAPAHVRIGWLRSVCNIWHVFGSGSFLDELAHAAGKDPAEFLLQSLGEGQHLELGEGVVYPNYNKPLEEYPIDLGRLRGVVERVKASAWGREVPAGHGLGIAAHRSFHAYVAAVVEAKVDERGQVHVPRVDLAIDLGTVINPDRVLAQMEGSIVFGLSLALYGEISAKDGRIVEGNFHEYRLQRIHEAPEIHVEIVESEALPGGAGEPGVPPIAPALANAIFAACGQRLRDLPLRPEAK